MLSIRSRNPPCPGINLPDSFTPILRLNSDSALCNAKVRLDELEETLGLGVTEGAAETLGGFLYEMIGRVPRVGDQIRRDGIDYKIHSVLSHRIDKVLIKGLSSIEKRSNDAIS